MSTTFGEKLRISIFGESHGEGVGVVIDGLPAGFFIDFAAVNRCLSRRAPGSTHLVTPRKEEDSFHVFSGLLEGKTTGAPLMAFTVNQNQHSGDYNPEILRPSHGDLGAFLKHQGHADLRGGGHYSGRLTAPLVFAGAIAEQLLATKGIQIGARFSQIGDVYDTVEITPTPAIVTAWREKQIPLYAPSLEKNVLSLLENCRDLGDSVGAVVQCFALGIQKPLGAPFFDSLESRLSHLFFSIPGVKGVSFGLGFDFAQMRGSEVKDELFWDKNKEIKAKTNHNGGISGGIATKMPLAASLCFKPTASIFSPQETVNIATGEGCTHRLRGRHDPCIALRGLPVVEAAMALVLLDFYLMEESPYDHTGNPAPKNNCKR